MIRQLILSALAMISLAGALRAAWDVLSPNDDQAPEHVRRRVGR